MMLIKWHYTSIGIHRLPNWKRFPRWPTGDFDPNQLVFSECLKLGIKGTFIQTFSHFFCFRFGKILFLTWVQMNYHSFWVLDMMKECFSYNAAWDKKSMVNLDLLIRIKDWSTVELVHVTFFQEYLICAVIDKTMREITWLMFQAIRSVFSVIEALQIVMWIVFPCNFTLC